MRLNRYGPRFLYAPDEPPPGAPPADPPPADPPPADPPAPPPADTPWIETFPEDIREKVSKFADGGNEALGRAYVSAEQKIGEQGIKPPTKDSDAAEVREWFTTLGCPAVPAEYKLAEVAWPEGMKADENFETVMRQEAWDIGVPQPVFERIYDKFTKLQILQNETTKEAWKNWATEGIAELEKDWGAAFEERKGWVEQAGALVFGEQWTTISRIPMPDGKPLGSHPAFIKPLADLWEKTGEGRLVDGRVSGSGSGMMTVDQAKAALTSKMADSGFIEAFHNKTNTGHNEAVAEHDRLYAMAYPGDGSTEGATVRGAVEIGGL
jgi:hypothetical protein